MVNIAVVNIKHSSYDIRIDRRTRWGNPYSVETFGRVLAIQHYEQHIDGRPHLVELLMHEVLKLNRDTVRLGCHCKPNPCHGDVLRRLLLERLE